MVLAFLLLIPVVVDIVRRPTFRRLAFRSVSRRRGEAALVIVGALLGTAIITASGVVGDTIEASIRDGARTDLGPIDETVRLVSADQLAATHAAIASPPIAGVDGLLDLRAAGAVIADDRGDRKAQPNASMVELDFDQARSFGSDPAITGLAAAGPTPSGTDAVISQHLADLLGVQSGSTVEVFAYGKSQRFSVRQVIDGVGLAGYVPVRSGVFSAQRPDSILVPPGSIDALAAGTDLAKTAAPPVNEILVSNAGGVFDSTGPSESIANELATRTTKVSGVQVTKNKADLLDSAKRQGDSISQLYQGIGYFSVIAGILLLVNLIVMLSEERKTELGMLRALGFKRNHLVRTFAIEGAVYSFVAAVLGAILGVGVGAVISKVAANIFSSGRSAVTLPLSVKPTTLVAGAALGLAISMFTVWGTSFRIARLNIIRAIRDLPEPKVARRGQIAAVLGAVGVVIGLLLFGLGWSRESAIPLLAGPAIALFCLIPILGRWLPRKPVTIAVAGAVLLWGITIFTLLGDHLGRADILVFVVQGIVLVSAGVILLAQADRVWQGLAGLVSSSGRGLAPRLGLAYPLARKFRTSLLLAMYSIVIFTMTFISVLAGIFGNQVPQFTDDVRSGYDLYVDSSQGNPLTVDQLREVPGVASVSPLTVGLVRAVTVNRTEGTQVKLTGFESSLIDQGATKLETRGAAYASDRAAFEAVLNDPNLIITGQRFASRNQGGGPPQKNLEPGDVVTVTNNRHEEKKLTVAGVVGSDFVFNNAFVSATFLRDFAAPLTVQNRHYVRVAPGTDAEQVATAINGRFITNGADASTFHDTVATLLDANVAFFALLRGYLGLGLLIGIAGLGVVMVRAVRERRREIGMLRAMGFASGVVRRAFVLEAGFIALQGIILGIGLGMITAYNLIVNSEAFGSQKLDFSWPWVVLALVALVPLVASLLATAWPATQASRIRPAVALRIAD